MKQINPYKMFVGAFIPNWLMLQKEITPGMKLIYARLCQFAGENGECYPSIEKLSQETGIGLSQVKDNLKKLKELKLIKSTRRGLGKTNVYIFLEHKWMQLSREPESRPSVGAESRPSVEPESRLQRESVKENQLKDKKNSVFSLNDFLKIVKEFLDDEKIFKSLKENTSFYFDHRQSFSKDKRLTKSSTRSFIKKLMKDSKDNLEDANTILENSVANGWQGIFALNGNGNQSLADKDKKLAEQKRRFLAMEDKPYGER